MLLEGCTGEVTGTVHEHKKYHGSQIKEFGFLESRK